MKYTPVFALFFMFIFCTAGKGQNKTEPRKDNTTSETKDVITSYGPNSITRTIKQDRKGNIWIASWEGVFRYDGKSFTNITSKVSSARFFSVLEDKKGNFWLSSVGSGVFYYDGKSFQNFTTKDGLTNDQVIDIYEDKTGNIWFGTVSGASSYNGKSFKNYLLTGRWPALFDKDDNEVNSIIEDKTGKFWFGTRGNACIYDRKGFTVLTHKGTTFKNVRKIIEDKKGNIWLGGNSGLWRYNGSTFTNFTTDFVGFVYEDKKGNIWTTSQNAIGSWSLSRYDGKSLADKKPAVTEIKSHSGMLFGILEDNDGNIWYCSGHGVHRYDGTAITDFSDK